MGTASANYYDAAFVQAFASADVARPFVGNLNAPASSAGVYAADGCVVAQATGNPIANQVCSLAPTQLISLNSMNNGAITNVASKDVRYIVNAATSQSIFGTPYGARRNLSQDATTDVGNLSILKKIKLNERASFEFRTTMLNAFNHANFQSVDPVIEDAGLTLQGTGFGNPSLTNDGSTLGNRRIIFGGTVRF
jgi:hypothetical protein